MVMRISRNESDSGISRCMIAKHCVEYVWKTKTIKWGQGSRDFNRVDLNNNNKMRKTFSIFVAFIPLVWRGQWPPLQYSRLENPMDGGAWWAAVHGVAKSQTWLSDFTFTFPFTLWRRKWQPTPVFLPGESQGWGSLVGCRLWGHTESDTTEAT